MTDRLAGFVVTLETDLCEDDAAATIAALKQIKGVLTVEPLVNDVRLIKARAQARGELTAMIWKAIEKAWV